MNVFAEQVSFVSEESCEARVELFLNFKPSHSGKKVLQKSWISIRPVNRPKFNVNSEV